MFNFSSPILQDYKHLLRVYHDMVFRPLLRK
jgi:Zn-dependent M16 (insulinase) family peptidase